MEYVPIRKSILDDLEQKKTDESAVSGALQGVQLIWKLNAAGMGEALKYYGKAHSAVKAGVGNIINSAFGDDYFEPIQAAIEGFRAGDISPEVVTRPIFERLERTLPSIHTPRNYNEVLKYSIPIGEMLPDVPQEIEPKTFLKPLSKASEVAIDVATDPLLPIIGPVFKGVRGAARLSGLSNVIKSAVKKSVEILPKNLVDLMTWAFTVRGGRDADFINLMDKYFTADQKAKLLSGKMAQSLSAGLNKQQQMLLGQRIRGDTGKLAAELEEKSRSARTLLDDMGREYAREGFISEETFFKNVGRYFPRLYRSKEYYEQVARKWGIATTRTPQIGATRAMRRKDIPADVRKAMGEIIEPAYPMAKAIQQIKHDLNVNNLFKAMEKNPEWVLESVPKGTGTTTKIGDKVYKQVKSAAPTKLVPGGKWGRLEGKYIRDDILRELKQVYYIPSKLGKTYLKALTMYKLMKVLPNPATHTRNVFSAALMLDLSPTGAGTLATLPKKLIQAGKEVHNKGKFFNELIENGAWNLDFYHTDLLQHLDMLNDVDDVVGFAEIVPNTIFDYVKKYGVRGGRRAVEVLGRLYSGEDNIFKMAHYIHARTKMGMEVPQAIEYMRKWGFDYSKVSPAIQFARNYVSPFITYQAKALPRVAEVILTNPARFYKWPVIFNAIDRMSARTHNMSDEDLDTVKGSARGQVMLLPWVDSADNPLTLDLTYMLPWGDMQEAGGLFGLPPSLTMSNPAVTIPAQLAFNKNIYFDSPIMTDIGIDGRRRWGSMENWQKGIDFIYKSIMPSVVPGGYSWEKVAKAVSPVPEHRLSPSGKPYDLDRTILDVIFGLKTRGIDVDEKRVFERLDVLKWKKDRERRLLKIEKREDLTEEEKDKLKQKEIDLVRETLEKELAQ